MNNNSKTTVILDTLGRIIVGIENEEKSSKSHLALANPAILNVTPQQGSMQVQIFPMIFRELQADTGQDVVWLYNRDNITENTGLDLDFKVQAQYQQMTSAPPATIGAPQAAPPAPAPAPAAAEPIKLFDD